MVGAPSRAVSSYKKASVARPRPVYCTRRVRGCEYELWPIGFWDRLSFAFGSKYRTYPTVAVRTSHVDDVRAGRSPWHGGLREVLPDTLGLRVVQFLPIRPHRRTRLLRLWSAVSAVARQRGGLAWSSSVRRLVRVAGHRPQPPGSRLVYNSWSFFYLICVEFRC